MWRKCRVLSFRWRPGLGRGARGSIGAARDAFGAPQRIIFGPNGSEPSKTNEATLIFERRVKFDFMKRGLDRARETIFFGALQKTTIFPIYMDRRPAFLSLITISIARSGKHVFRPNINWLVFQSLEGLASQNEHQKLFLYGGETLSSTKNITRRHQFC